MASLVTDFVRDTVYTLRHMNYRQLVQQFVQLGLIVTSALIIWKTLMVVTGSKSPVRPHAPRPLPARLQRLTRAPPPRRWWWCSAAAWSRPSIEARVLLAAAREPRSPTRGALAP